MMFSSEPLDIGIKHHLMHGAWSLIGVKDKAELSLDMRMNIIELRILEIEIVLR